MGNGGRGHGGHERPYLVNVGGRGRPPEEQGEITLATELPAVRGCAGFPITLPLASRRLVCPRRGRPRPSATSSRRAGRSRSALKRFLRPWKCAVQGDYDVAAWQKDRMNRS